MADEPKRINIIKYLMFVFNLFFWISGLALIIIGGIIAARYGKFFNYLNSQYAQVAGFIIAIGVIVAIIGFLGCLGAIRLSYPILIIFSVLLFIVFIMEIVAASIGFAHKKQVGAAVDRGFNKAIAAYGVIDGDKKFVDWAQQTLKCCGYDSPDNFANNGTVAPPFCGAGQGVESCHKGNKCTGEIYPNGCGEELRKFLESKMGQIGAVAIVVAVIQFVGILFACLLARDIKKYEL